MTLSSYETIPPNPFSQEFREMFGEMREQLVEFIEMRVGLEELLERPWPIVDLGAPAEEGGVHAVVDSFALLTTNRWLYVCKAAFKTGGVYVAEPEGEVFNDVVNLIEQQNTADVVSHGVDVADTAEFTVIVSPIPAGAPVIIHTSGPDEFTFSEPNATNFTCIP